MNLVEAMTRRDRWQPIQVGDRGKYRVGRIMDSSGSTMWARGYTRYPGTRRGPIITFTHHAHAHALARACSLNRADAEASR